MTDKSFLGKDARLEEGPTPLMARMTFGSELERYAFLSRWLSVADMAHAKALIDAGILSSEIGVELLEGLIEAHEAPQPETDPVVGDLYNNRDADLRRRIGPVVDNLHTGRARREATTLAWHLETREAVEESIQSVAALVRTLTQLARAHANTVMPDFTYLQHAHPTTLGHYLLGFAYPLSRDVKRLRDLLDVVNLSPAGSGSVNGSRLPIDREALARDLEFDGLMVHTRDAMWAPDLALTAVASSMSAFVTIDRLAEELIVWATAEFGFFSPADRHSRTSVIMPQKKNPYAAALTRGYAREHLGRLVAVVSTNLTVTGQPDNRILSYGEVPTGLRLLSGTASLLAEQLEAGTFDENRLAEAASTGYTGATEIADWLTMEFQIPNRDSHRVIGAAVRIAELEGDAVLTSAHLDAAAEQLETRPLGIDDDQLALLQSPEQVLGARRGRGSAADIPEMISELEAVLDIVPEARYAEFETRYLESTRSYLREREQT